MDTSGLTFGQWLRQRRTALRLTQHQLGQLAMCAGESIRKMEAEQRRPSRDVARLLAIALQISQPDNAAFILFARGERATSPRVPGHEDRTRNIPSPLTPLIGRDTEVEQVCTLLQRHEVRLVTLIGPGGVGKTRLSVAIAMHLFDTFTDGVRVVALASVTRPEHVASAIAQSLGVPESGALPVIESLLVHLRHKHMLLVLDNFEHVIAAAPHVVTLLQASPRLTVLATSRETLGLSGEHVIAVEPLSLPPTLPGTATVHALVTGGNLLHSPAIRLFVDRATAARSGFVLTAEDSPAVAEICRRLDGLPLAIELAAARMRLFSPQTLLARLDDRWTIVAGGTRDAHARHQTLRATIDWSYDLLSPTEQVLFARLAIFAGGWTLDAAEAVCAADDMASRDVLEGVESLVAKSLVQVSSTAEGVRFSMLETIRAYAMEHLTARGEIKTMRCRHLIFFRDLAERLESSLHTVDQVHGLNSLEDELPNMRMALETALDDPMMADGARLASAAASFWHLRGHDGEADQWFQRLLHEQATLPIGVRAKARAAGALFAFLAGDHARVQAWCDEAISLCQEVDDDISLSNALALLGRLDEALEAACRSGSVWQQAYIQWHLAHTWMLQDIDQATRFAEASLLLFQRIGDAWGIGWTSMALGEIAHRRGADDCAMDHYEEARTRTTAIGHSAGIGGALMGLGRVAAEQGDTRQASVLLDDALARFREAGHRINIAMVVCLRGSVSLKEGDIRSATTLLTEGLTLYEALDDRAGIAWARDLLGHVALHDDHQQTRNL